MPAFKSVRLPRPMLWQLPSPPESVQPLVTSTPTTTPPTGPTLMDVMRGINELKSDAAKIKSEISNLKKNQGKILDALNTITHRQWLAAQLDICGFDAIEEYLYVTMSNRSALVNVEQQIAAGTSLIGPEWTRA